MFRVSPATRVTGPRRAIRPIVDALRRGLALTRGTALCAATLLATTRRATERVTATWLAAIARLGPAMGPMGQTDPIALMARTKTVPTMHRSAAPADTPAIDRTRPG